METLGLRDKDFYRRVLRLCIPIMLQQLINTAMYMVDTIMIGGLGDIELAGVGAANQLAFILDTGLFGIVGGGGIFIAQYFGKKDNAGIRSKLGLCIILSAAFSLLFLLVAQFAGEFCVSLFSEEQAVIDSGMAYLSIASWGYLAKFIIYPFGTAHKSCNNAKLPMISGSAGLVVNLFLNYCLIFGNLGFPAMGVEGAAYATIIGSMVDAVTLLICTYVKETPVRAKWKELFSNAFVNFSEFFRVSMPVFFDDAVWALGMIVQNYIYGRMGTDTFAATMIVNTVDKISFILLIGVGTAAAVIVGNTLGEGSREKALTYGKRLLYIAGGIGIVTAVLVCTLGTRMPYLYVNAAPQTQAIASEAILVMGFAMPLWALNFTMIVGLMRGGGDTRAAAVIDLVPLWLIALPLSALAGLHLGWSLAAVYAFQHISAVVRLVLSLRRVRGGQWIRQLV